jgi:hypothetical protein
MPREHMTIEIAVVYNALFALNDLLTGIPLPSAWFLSITTHHFLVNDVFADVLNT